MSEINRVRIQDFIEYQIPEFLNEDSPLFKEFLSQYYLSQEYPTGVIDLAENIKSFKDIPTYNNELFYSVFYPSEITSKLLSFSDTINVTHTVGFPEKYGLIKINDEIITYSGKTATSFTGCIRGFSGIDGLKSNYAPEILNFSSTTAKEHSEKSKVINLSLVFYSEFFTKFKEEFLPGFENRQFTPQVNIKNILSRAIDFYTSKGTDTSYKILFKVLYNEDVSLIKPQDYLLRCSDNNYFSTNNILVEKIRGGDPFEIKGSTLFQDIEGAQSSASIYSIEYRPVDDKDLYEIYLDTSSFVGNFSVTKKTNISEYCSITSDTIFVDSTIGFPKSGNLVVKSKKFNQTYTISYSDKTNTQFIGVQGLVSDLDFNDELYEENFAYSYTKNGSKIEFRTINVVGDINFENSSGLLENDKIKLFSFGAELNDKPEFNSWIYNVPTSHELSKINRSGDTTGTLWTIELFDSVKFYLNETIYLTNPDNPDDQKVFCIVKNILSNNKIEIFSDQDISNKKILNKQITKGISNNDQHPQINSIPTAITNTYIDDKNEYYYVSSTGIPNYSVYSKPQKILVSTSSGIGKTDILNTNIIHKFYTGEKIYYYSSENSGISSGLYYATCIGDTKDSDKIKLSTSKSDLYSQKYVSVNLGITSDFFVKEDYQDRILSNQKLFKKFNYLKSSNALTEVESRSTNNKKIGMLINGVELYSPTLFDENIYYGKIDSIIVTNSGNGYDVINPSDLEIFDVSGKNANGFFNITGSLSEIKVINPGIGYQNKPKVSLIGGNGTNCSLESNLVKTQINSGFRGDGNGLNPTTNTITFQDKHNFDNGEEVIYNSNGNLEISPLKNNSSYFVKVINNKEIKLYNKFSEIFNGTSEINLVGISSGIHYFKSSNLKNTITKIYIKDPGKNYSNKKIVIPSDFAHDNKTNGINVFDHYIFAKNHSFKEKDVLRYSTTGSVISGLSTSLEYMVTVLDDNKFKLSLVGVGSDSVDINYLQKKYIKFNDSGIGTHTFYYPPIKVLVESVSGIGATTIIEPELDPVVLGKIESIFLSDTGVGYGVSDIINFHRRPDIRVKPIISDALLRPIIVNGSITDVQILSSGEGYNGSIDIIAIGDGFFADFNPIIIDGKISSIKIINPGIGYNSKTTLIIKRRGSDAKFLANVFEWKINQIEKNKLIVNPDDEGVLVPSNNKDFGLQFIHFNVPKKLRKIIKDNIDLDDIESFTPFHSPIIGWAYDGNPIYGPYGQVGKEIRRVVSSYAKKIELNTGLRPSFPAGFFDQDYFFDAALGDLDEYNGRFCVTPEFPNGTYAYFSTIDNSSISNIEYPYVIGREFKNYVIKENNFPSFNQDFDIEELNLIRNVSPYYINYNKSFYGLINKLEDKYKQEFVIKNTLSSSIDNIRVYYEGEDYRVGDNIIFDNTDTGGTGASAQISRVKGKPISTLFVGISTYKNTEFYTQANRTLGITSVPHGLQTGEKINISAISNSLFSNFEGDKSIFVAEKNTGITTDISNYSITGPTTSIFVSDVSGFSINDFISIDKEKLQIVDIYPKTSQFLVNRLENTGIHTAGISTVTLLPNKFYFENKNDKFNVLNKKIYFSSKNFIGFGTQGTTYTIDGIPTLITQGTIYIPNHNLYNGQQVLYTVGLGGTGIFVSPSTVGLSYRLQDNQKIYIVNKGKDLIGFSTVSIDSVSGISSNFSSLNFYDNPSTTGIAHGLETLYPKVLGQVENYFINIETETEHNLNVFDNIRFNFIPEFSTNIKIRYDSVIRKVTSDIILFNSQNDVTSGSEIYIPNHDFKTGDKIVYYSYNTQELQGLENNKTYFVIKNNSDYIKLSQYLSDSYLGKSINISFSGNFAHGIAKINPLLIFTKNNKIIFDLSDSSLSGMDLKIYQDEKLKIELETYRYERNYIEAGSNGAELVINNLKNELPNTLFYNLIPLSPSVIEKNQISSDYDVLGNNKLVFGQSVFNNEYKIFSLDSNAFKINLSQKPETFKYSLSDEFGLYYDTDSKNTIGPISDVRINYGGIKYKKIPRIAKIESEFGKNSFLKPESKLIGKIDSVDRIKDGFDYPTDKTLRPILSTPTICQVNSISRIDNVGIITGGRNYQVPPVLKVIGNDEIILTSEIQGETVSKVNIVKNSTSLLLPLKIIPTRNSNGFDIDEIVYNQNTNTVTLELINVNNQLYPLKTIGVGSTETVFPFKIGDEIFIENCRINDNGIKNNYNSKDWNYVFFKVTNVNETNYTVTYSMSGIGVDLGDYTTDFGYGYVVNKNDMAEFEMNIVDDTNYISGETVFGYDSLGDIVFSAKVMDDGWDGRINQLKLLDSKGELKVGNKLLGQKSNLNGIVEYVNQFNLNSVLSIYRQKINDLGDKVGHLNDYQQKISDNNYYQKFSYAIKTRISYDEWKHPVRSLIHPSGFKEFCDLEVLSTSNNSMKVGVNTSTVGLQINIDNLASTQKINNFSLVTEDEQFEDGSIERIIFPEGINLTSYILSKTNKVLKIDDIEDQFTGIVTSIGGNIVGITSFKLKYNSTPLFYREFDSQSSNVVSLNDDKFIVKNHNFQSGQKIKYSQKIINEIPEATATSVVDDTFAYPSVSDNFDSPIVSFDSNTFKFDSN